jgi:hypothetical protein
MDSGAKPVNGLFDFDWVSNPKLVLNLLISMGVSGGIGATLVWFASDPGTPYLSKVVLAGGFGPALVAFREHISKIKDSHQTDKVKAGMLPDRRVRPHD